MVVRRLPEVPVIVTVSDPAFAVLDAVNVRTLVEVAGFGLKVAVTPAGSFDATKVTLPEKAFAGTTEIALVALPPASRMTALGEAVKVKLGFPTVRLIGMLLVNSPDVPEIITVTVAVATLAATVRVSVLLEVVGFALNAAVTPVGKPDTESVTLPRKPFTGVMVTVFVVLPPGATNMMFGEGKTMKLGPLVGHSPARLVTFTEPIPVEKSQPVVAI